MAILTNPDPKPIGLILSGGGSRAAYQIGVLRAVANILPKDAANPFRVMSGTSAGALNAVSLATHAHRLRTGVRTLEYIWKNISSDQIYDPQSGNLLSSASSLVLSMLSGKTTESSSSLLQNGPLGKLLERVIKFEKIQHNIDIGLIDAVSVTASAYSSGESVSFYQAVKGIHDWEGPHRIGLRTQLQLNHLMASTAIPLIFPSVQIENQFYGDGAIRQIAPTSTAIQLGARRIFAVGVSGNRSKALLQDEMDEQPSLLQIIGHILNSAFVDTLENDLEFLQKLNQVIPHVPPGILAQHDIAMTEVDLLEISPSKELSLLAMEYYDELPKPMSRYIKAESSGAMLSLILFEKGFCSALWQLGFNDAMAKEDEIRTFFASS
jgi:NTE family protein